MYVFQNNLISTIFISTDEQLCNLGPFFSVAGKYIGSGFKNMRIEERLQSVLSAT